VYGSESTLNVARGSEIEAGRLKSLDAGCRVDVGSITVTPLASLHSPKPIGGEGAEIEDVLPQPAKLLDYKEGGTFDFLVETKGRRILFKGSANWVPDALDGVKAEVLFLAVAGLGKAEPAFVQDYFSHTIGATGPQLVIATHWNDFFAPVAAPLPLHPRFVDQGPRAFDRLLAQRGTPPAFDVRILDALASVRLTCVEEAEGEATHR
jgi:L-ascorbate metabolism protein UlaG (beta-lactamase superfamily)